MNSLLNWKPEPLTQDEMRIMRLILEKMEVEPVLTRTMRTANAFAIWATTDLCSQSRRVAGRRVSRMGQKFLRQFPGSEAKRLEMLNARLKKALAIYPEKHHPDEPDPNLLTPCLMAGFMSLSAISVGLPLINAYNITKGSPEEPSDNVEGKLATALLLSFVTESSLRGDKRKVNAFLDSIIGLIHAGFVPKPFLDQPFGLDVLSPN